MAQTQPNPFDDLINLVMHHGTDAMAQAFATLLNHAMLIEREQHVGARAYQRSDGRAAYANGIKPKTLDTPAGRIRVDVPKTRGLPGMPHEPFFPASLERGTRACRVVVATIAQMDLQGVSTRDVGKVMAELGLENVTSSQVSRATAALDDELKKWRNRPLGEVPQLILDARYEKVRHEGVVIDVAVLTAVGILPDGRRTVLGTSVALSEAEVHWRAFLDGLVARGMRGVTYVVSDDHAGLAAARRKVLPSVPWQRCQFHLAQNAVHHCPSQEAKSQIGDALREVFQAKDRPASEQALKHAVEQFEEKAPKLAAWIEKNVPEGMTCFLLPKSQRRRLRTSNGIERPIQQELKRRTRKIRVFPNVESLLRLVSAILVEIDDAWTSSTKRYLPEAGEVVAR